MRLVLLLCLLATQAPAQGLLPQPDLAPGVAAAPRLPEATPAAASINARLSELDDAAAGRAQDQAFCDASDSNEYTRQVAVTLATPTLISLLITEGGYCAPAAHPWMAQSPRTFDRLSGAEIDPKSWLPAFLAPGPKAAASTADRSLASTSALTELYIATALRSRDAASDLACLALLRQVPHNFLAWPMTQPPGLALQPIGLAYVDSPCETPVTIALPTLRSLQFAPALLAALSL